MLKLNRKKIMAEERQWNQQKKLIEIKHKIKQEKKQFKPKIFTTTKLLVLFLFINCTIIEVFTGWATVQSLNNSLITGQPTDFAPLIALIGAIVGEVMGFAIYAIKSLKENSVGGIVYEQSLKDNIFNNQKNTDEAVG